MTMSKPTRKRSSDTLRSGDITGWLVLAASPTFASMAWISANDIQVSICASPPGMLPISGMAFMYLLMSLFHLSPWLKLASAYWRQCPFPKTQGD